MDPLTEALGAGGPALPQVRRLRTEIPGPRSQALHARRTAAVARGVHSTVPVYASAAGGGVVVDVDGNSLIDMSSGIAVVNVGNAAPGVHAAVAEQASRFTHTCFMVTPYEGYVEVCERLNRLTPGAHDKRSALFTSGAEAVENAIKIARRHTGRDAVVVLDHAYHGRTNLTMAMTAKAHPYKTGFGPFAGEVYRVPTSYPYRDPVLRSGPVSGQHAADRTIDAIETHVGPDRVAALVVEPIQGEGGFIVPAPGFLPALAAWCRQRGVVFIADEIQTGFARTGDLFACEHEGLIPDLITTAKGLAGGLPLSAVTGRAEIMDSVHPGGLGGTYGGNPVAAAAAIATMDLMLEQDLPGRARRISEIMLPRLQALAAAHPCVGDVRGRGAMLAIELVRPDTRWSGASETDPGWPSAGEPDVQLTSAVNDYCHRHGVLTLTAGTYGNVLRFLPPLVMPEHLLVEALDILDEAFTQVDSRPTG